MDKKVKIGISLIALAAVVYFLTRKNKKIVAQNEVVLPDVEQLNSDDEEYFLTNDESPIIFEFKQNLQSLYVPGFSIPQGSRMMQKQVTPIADEEFMQELTNAIDNSEIADGDKLDINFVKDFNIVIGNIIKNDFKYKANPMIEYTDAEVFKKGDRGIEIGKLKEIINNVVGANHLRSDGNYDKKLFDVTSRIFIGTSVYSDANEFGTINKDFINNLHNLLIKTKGNEKK